MSLLKDKIGQSDMDAGQQPLKLEDLAISIKSYKCFICTEKTERFDRLQFQEHYASEHMNGFYLHVCKGCNQQFVSNALAVSHVCTSEGCKRKVLGAKYGTRGQKKRTYQSELLHNGSIRRLAEIESALTIAEMFYADEIMEGLDKSFVSDNVKTAKIRAQEFATLRPFGKRLDALFNKERTLTKLQSKEVVAARLPRLILTTKVSTQAPIVEATSAVSRKRTNSGSQVVSNDRKTKRERRALTKKESGLADVSVIKRKKPDAEEVVDDLEDEMHAPSLELGVNVSRSDVAIKKDTNIVEADFSSNQQSNINEKQKDTQISASMKRTTSTRENMDAARALKIKPLEIHVETAVAKLQNPSVESGSKGSYTAASVATTEPAMAPYASMLDSPLSPTPSMDQRDLNRYECSCVDCAPRRAGMDGYPTHEDNASTAKKLNSESTSCQHSQERCDNGEHCANRSRPGNSKSCDRLPKENGNDDSFDKDNEESTSGHEEVYDQGLLSDHTTTPKVPHQKVGAQYDPFPRGAGTAGGTCSSSFTPYTQSSDLLSHAPGVVPQATDFFSYQPESFSQQTGSFSHAAGVSSRAPDAFSQTNELFPQAQSVISRAPESCPARAFSWASGSITQAQDFTLREGIPMQHTARSRASGSMSQATDCFSQAFDLFPLAPQVPVSTAPYSGSGYDGFTQQLGVSVPDNSLASGLIGSSPLMHPLGVPPANLTEWQLAMSQPLWSQQNLMANPDLNAQNVSSQAPASNSAYDHRQPTPLSLALNAASSHIASQTGQNEQHERYKRSNIVKEENRSEHAEPQGSVNTYKPTETTLPRKIEKPGRRISTDGPNDPLSALPLDVIRSNARVAVWLDGIDLDNLSDPEPFNADRHVKLVKRENLSPFRDNADDTVERERENRITNQRTEPSFAALQIKDKNPVVTIEARLEKKPYYIGMESDRAENVVSQHREDGPAEGRGQHEVPACHVAGSSGTMETMAVVSKVEAPVDVSGAKTRGGIQDDFGRLPAPVVAKSVESNLNGTSTPARARESSSRFSTPERYRISASRASSPRRSRASSRSFSSRRSFASSRSYFRASSKQLSPSRSPSPHLFPPSPKLSISREKLPLVERMRLEIQRKEAGASSLPRGSDAVSRCDTPRRSASRTSRRSDTPRSGARSRSSSSSLQLYPTQHSNSRERTPARSHVMDRSSKVASRCSSRVSVRSRTSRYSRERSRSRSWSRSRRSRSRDRYKAIYREKSCGRSPSRLREKSSSRYSYRTGTGSHRRAAHSPQVEKRDTRRRTRTPVRSRRRSPSTERRRETQRSRRKRSSSSSSSSGSSNRSNSPKLWKSKSTEKKTNRDVNRNDLTADDRNSQTPYRLAPSVLKYIAQADEAAAAAAAAVASTAKVLAATSTRRMATSSETSVIEADKERLKFAFLNRLRSSVRAEKSNETNQESQQTESISSVVNNPISQEEQMIDTTFLHPNSTVVPPGSNRTGVNRRPALLPTPPTLTTQASTRKGLQNWADALFADLLQTTRNRKEVTPVELRSMPIVPFVTETEFDDVEDEESDDVEDEDNVMYVDDARGVDDLTATYVKTSDRRLIFMAEGRDYSEKELLDISKTNGCLNGRRPCVCHSKYEANDVVELIEIDD